MSRGRAGFDHNFSPPGQAVNPWPFPGKHNGPGTLQKEIEEWNVREQQHYNAPRRALEELMRRCREEGYSVVYQDLLNVLETMK